MARSHPHPEPAPKPERAPLPERAPTQVNPNPFLQPRRAAGTRQGQPSRPQPGRPAHLPNPRFLPSSQPRPRPVRRGGMR
jgi:hypothetical protein